MSLQKVVLVHGIFDTSRKMQSLARQLQRDGFETFTPTLNPSNGDVGLDVLAEQLRDYIHAHLDDQTPFSLVGFSMGGIVSRYYVQRLGGAERVKRFITISSPHHGTAFAWLRNGAGVRQMRPNSDFLNALNGDTSALKRTRFASLWTPLDLMIIPATNSKVPFGENFPVFSIAHPLMVFQRSSQRLVAKLLRE